MLYIQAAVAIPPTPCFVCGTPRIPSKHQILSNLLSVYNHYHNKNFVVWAINDKKQVRQFLNLLIDNPLLDYKCSAKTKILKILYGIENNLSYKEYAHLEEDLSV